MSLIDINELPQPIYPDQKPETADTTETTEAANITETTAPAAPAPAANEPQITSPEAGDTKTSSSSLLQSTKVKIAAVALGVLGVVGALGQIGANATSEGRGFSSNQSNSSATSEPAGNSLTAIEQAANTTPAVDVELAGALDELLFFYTSPSASDFECMASTLNGYGVSNADLQSGNVDVWSLAEAVSGCVSSSTMVQETQGLLTDMYGAGYTTDCLVQGFSSFGAADWYQWIGSTGHLDINGVDQALYSIAPNCFG